MHAGSQYEATVIGRVAAILLAGFLAIGTIDRACADSEATGGAESSGEAQGSDTASAGQDASGSVSAGDDSASSDTQSSGEASQTSGGTTTDAGASTQSTANAQQEGSGYTASAGASGDGSTDGGAIGTVTATASAGTTSETPEASAETTLGGTTTTSAESVFGQSADAYAPGGEEFEKVGKRRTVAVAMLPDGTYSVAITTKNTALAKSGAYTGFKGNNLQAAIRSLVSAFAKATRTSGYALASASSSATSRNAGGFAIASSRTFASACIGDNCQKRKLSRRLLSKILKSCEWHARAHTLYCPDRQLALAFGRR